jgi:cation:H+ antiporter
LLSDGIWLGLGVGLLIGGGEAVVRGASALARAAGVSPLIVGLTVVSLGTSAPELAVNLNAALRGSGTLSFGNVVGSNLANVGLVIGVAAMLRPFSSQRLAFTRDIPMLGLATLVALGLALDPRVLDAVWARNDGLVLLLVLGVFVYYTAREARRDARRAGTVEPAVAGRGEVESERPLLPTRTSVGLVVAGVVGLALGGQLAVDGAVGLARGLGVSEAVIGLTVVAIGTSLPELAASLAAVARGHFDIALGNVIGSNILNLLAVGGLCALITPIPIPAGGIVDLVASAGLSLVLWVVAASERHRVIRAEGALLLGLYVGYLYLRWSGAL